LLYSLIPRFLISRTSLKQKNVYRPNSSSSYVRLRRSIWIPFGQIAFRRLFFSCKLFAPPDCGDLHASVLEFPIVVSGLLAPYSRQSALAVLPTPPCLQNIDDLIFSKPGLTHYRRALLAERSLQKPLLIDDHILLETCYIAPQPIEIISINYTHR